MNPDVALPEANRKIYMDLLSDLKKKVVKKHGEPNDIILPLECHFLNKNAFISVVGHQPQVRNVSVIICKLNGKSRKSNNMFKVFFLIYV